MKVSLNVNAVGRGQVFLDGKPLPQVRRISVTAGVKQATQVELTLIGVDVEVEAEADKAVTNFDI